MQHRFIGRVAHDASHRNRGGQKHVVNMHVMIGLRMQGWEHIDIEGVTVIRRTAGHSGTKCSRVGCLTLYVGLPPPDVEFHPLSRLAADKSWTRERRCARRSLQSRRTNLHSNCLFLCKLLPSSRTLVLLISFAKSTQ
jgi:hypothetical protein